MRLRRKERSPLAIVYNPVFLNVYIPDFRVSPGISVYFHGKMVICIQFGLLNVYFSKKSLNYIHYAFFNVLHGKWMPGSLGRED